MFKNNRQILIITILTLIIMLSLTASLYSCSKNDTTVNIPKKITFLGTKYVDCRISSDYPFPADEEIVTIAGEVSEAMGSRTFPWIAAFADGKVLFDPATGDLLSNYKMLLDKEVKIKGYEGVGEITMRHPFNREEIEFIKFDNAFFVTEIIGWSKIEGYPVNEDTGEKSERPVILWVDTQATEKLVEK